ncbi:hypothetical protein EIN_081960 [Entamoeba invadens IP1]|uniref:hypothetical protein n=1 Tax=Entamoeba invadens IP1 TaxID=370355 RepID=UPI0002C3D856|nr:hypothetical protein EIN_081960 [Entamoeba invadens IP1]ELP85154.1 hypothetical protein EIN_081960 [Entamoeba invadens IP1]|eukprot:XP_004184500.1 hypothetical protein EIN_081960 [Entamoeba invadens IP1]
MPKGLINIKRPNSQEVEYKTKRTFFSPITQRCEEKELDMLGALEQLAALKAKRENRKAKTPQNLSYRKSAPILFENEDRYDSLMFFLSNGQDDTHNNTTQLNSLSVIFFQLFLLFFLIQSVSAPLSIGYCISKLISKSQCKLNIKMYQIIAFLFCQSITTCC